MTPKTSQNLCITKFPLWNFCQDIKNAPAGNRKTCQSNCILLESQWYDKFSFCARKNVFLCRCRKKIVSFLLEEVDAKIDILRTRDWKHLLCVAPENTWTTSAFYPGRTPWKNILLRFLCSENFDRKCQKKNIWLLFPIFHPK